MATRWRHEPTTRPRVPFARFLLKIPTPRPGMREPLRKIISGMLICRPVGEIHIKRRTETEAAKAAPFYLLQVL
jgi:hypothetical protein